MHHTWEILTQNLKNKLSTPGYQTFTSSTRVSSFEDGVLTLVVPNDFVMNWIKERCEHVIQEIFFDKYQQTVVLNFVVNPQFNFEEQEPVSAPKEALAAAVPEKAVEQKKTAASGIFNPKYNFDSFVVGNNNRFAHAAVIAVAESPAKAYNPLFIYGGSGVGKTHLMQALAQRALEINPFLKIVYIKTETFVNEMIEAIREGQNKINAFRNKYRTVDMLLIDDIQFLIGKEYTQEEFFHTFNALHESNKQIVLNSDRPPKELSKLEDRLKSRFAWGLIADIQPPDLETRMAILRKKSALYSLSVHDDVLAYVARQIPSNVRDMEGALTRIVANASLTGASLTVEFAAETLKNIYSSKQEKYITISTIKQVVAEHFKVDVEELSAKVRTKEIALARQVAMYLSKELTSSSLEKVGTNFGGRDHTTVLHACDKIKESLKTDPSLASMLQDIKTNIASR